MLSKEGDTWGFRCGELMDDIMYWNVDALHLYRRYVSGQFDGQQAIELHTYRVKLDSDITSYVEGRCTRAQFMGRSGEQHLLDLEKQQEERGKLPKN